MIQKKQRKSGRKWKFALAISIFSTSLAAASSISAQELTPVSVSSVGADKTLGTPIDEIISAVSSGGLSGDQNFSILKQDAPEWTFQGSISTDPATDDPASLADLPAPMFSSDSLKDLEAQGGLSSAPQIESSAVPTAFNLAVKFFEKVVFKKNVEFADRPIFDKGFDISGQPTFDKDTAGYAIIGKGNQSVKIDFDHEYDSPPVVTATLSLQRYKDPEVRAVAEDLLLISDVKYIITDVSKKSFEIMMDREADSDIPFSWHAFAVDDPTTSKKKGENSNGKIGADLSSDNAAASLSASADPAPSGQPETTQSPSASGANGSVN
jgi:hypothetical protein